MAALRRLLAQRRLAMLLCAATLLLKLLVPTGYMVGSSGGGLSLDLCSGVASSPMPSMADGAAGMHGGMAGHGGHKDHGRAEMPCAFSALSAASLGAVDPVQLAALIVFIMAVGLCLVVLPGLTPRAHLRPPLRGPPATL